MNKNKQNGSKLGLIIGIAGVFLILSEEWFIGIAGTVASTGLAIKAYTDSKSSE